MPLPTPPDLSAAPARRFGHHGVARLQRRPGAVRVVGACEQVRVGAERDGRVGVSELAGDEHDVQAVGDQQRGEPVAQRVQREPTVGADAAALHGGAEGLADVAVVECASERVGEHEVIRRLVGGGEPVLA